MTNIVAFEQQFPLVASRGIDEPTWNALRTSIYTGATDDSILMVLDYCKSRGLDPLMKPVHLVPMSVKNPVTGKYEFRDVVMPGINTYRIQASRSGDMAGTSSPIFGPEMTTRLGALDFTYPEWCEVTIGKLIGDRIVNFTAREYFLENYATKKRDDLTPNAMWFKRPKGQLAKCTEAQALRKGWPEIGQQPTYEEMVGKTEIEVNKPNLLPKTNDMGAVHDAIEVKAKPKPKAKAQKSTNASQSVFDAYAEAIENAQHPGELQKAFGEGWTLLKTSKGNEKRMETLQALYDEKKAYFEGLEADE